MNFGSLEKMNPAPDRAKTVESIRGDFTTPEAQKALLAYSAYLERN